MYRTAVGIAVHYSDRRPDVLHAVNKACREVAAPPRLDLRRRKRLARYLMFYEERDAAYGSHDSRIERGMPGSQRVG